MIRSLHEAAARVRRAASAALAAAVLAAACSPDEILRVTDPDIINPEDITSLAGAEALRVGALRRLNEATSGDESFFLYGGLLADEFRSADTFTERDETDKRTVTRENAQIDDGWRNLHQARVAAQLAIRGYERFAPPDEWKVGEMYMVQAYMEIMLAEHFCSGVPLGTVEDGVEVFAPGSSTEEVLESALAHLEQALTFLGDDPDFRVEYATRILQGRALVDLGRYAEAAAAVADVEDGYAYIMEHSGTTEENVIWQLNNSDKRYTVGSGDGGNGIPFATADDPRVPVSANGKGFDTTTDLFVQGIWTTNSDPVAIIMGREARLIEAEAALKANDYPAALGILNDLRAAGGIATPLLAAATPEEQVRQLFDERAYWLFATGHRLGDLRRMVRAESAGGYGLAEDAVFPTGAFFKGGEYGDDVNFPIPQSEDNNPAFTTSGNPGGCESRAP